VGLPREEASGQTQDPPERLWLWFDGKEEVVWRSLLRLVHPGLG